MSSKIPSSWFDDDPEWEMLRHKAENRTIPKQLKQRVEHRRPVARKQREAPRTQTKREDTAKEMVVSIKIVVPKVKLPDFKRLYHTHRQHILRVGGAVACLILVVGAFRFVTSRRSAQDTKQPLTAEERAGQAFTPLVPLQNVSGDSKQDKPEYAYDQEKKVLGYTTEYNGAILTLSQQALPEKVRSNPGELGYIAKSIGAFDPLQTQKGAAYVGTDTKGKTQTAVFATDQVLVFIRANKKLDTEEWKFYINQLNPAK